MLALVLAVALGLYSHAVADSKIRDGLALSIKGRYEESETILKSIPDREVTQYDLYHFARLLNNFAVNDKAKAEKHATALEDSFHNDLPIRYKALTHMMTEDLKQWKTNDLGDIGRDMRMSGTRLENAQGGVKTQKVQKEIVDKLDRLIKEREDKEAAAAAAAKAKEDQAKSKMPGQRQGQPAPDSNVTGGSGAGKVDEKRLKQIAANWGTMPPAERQRVTQELARELPPKYRPMIEEYFKALNNMPNRK